MITSKTLRRRIHEHREEAIARKIPIGEGFNMIVSHGVLFLSHDERPGERAAVGHVSGDRWILYRLWANDLRDLLGELPENALVNGSGHD